MYFDPRVETISVIIMSTKWNQIIRLSKASLGLLRLQEYNRLLPEQGNHQDLDQ